MKLIILLTSIVSLLISASFDCTKASTKIEKSICKDKRLNNLDYLLGKNYNFILKTLNKPYRYEFILAQPEWITKRNMCKSVECIEQSYTSRMDTFKKLIHDKKLIYTQQYPEVRTSYKENNKSQLFLKIRNSRQYFHFQ